MCFKTFCSQQYSASCKILLNFVIQEWGILNPLYDEAGSQFNLKLIVLVLKMQHIASWTACMHHFGSALQATEGYVPQISNSVWKK